MPVQAPLIDKRTYDEIVRQATELAEGFTCRDVESTPDNLCDQVLAEKVNYSGNSGTKEAPIGTVVTEELAEKISKTSGLSLIKIKGWQSGGSVKPTPETLRGQVLAEEIRYSDNGEEKVASIGTVVNEDLAKKISALALSSVRIKDGKDNPGDALIHIFARMAEQVIERLNQAPEKNFRAFLDLIGTRLAPPQPARAPLTFSLAEGSTQEGFVPAGTQVAAATEGGEIIFEIERDLVVIPAKLARVIVHDVEREHYADYTDASQKGVEFSVFASNKPIESLYLACDEIFDLPGEKTVALTIKWTGKAPEFLNYRWSYSNGKPTDNWQDLERVTKSENSQSAICQWDVTITNPPVPVSMKIADIPAKWIRVQPTQDALMQETIAQIKSVTARLTQRSGLSPDYIFCAGLPGDLTTNFYPFGERPRKGDTFYLASKEVFAQANATVTIEFVLNQLLPPQGHGVTVSWEVYDQDKKWSSLEIQASDGEGAANLTSKGSVQFTLPETTDFPINNKAARWIRATISQGNYGEEAYIKKDGDNYIPVPATFKPPLLASIKLGYVKASELPCQYMTYSGSAYQTALPSASAGAEKASGAEPPSLLLGFDRPLPNRPVALYVQVKSSDSPSPPIAWEYGSKPGKELDWKPLDLQGDDTRGLTQSGLITFIGPHDLAQATLFGQNLYWLRVRPEKGTPGSDSVASPVLKRLLTNTTWASHAATVRDETLGSGTGEPGQVVRTARGPVLVGQQIEVREPESPGAADRADIEREEGAEAVSAAGAAGAWVRWHEVTDFYASRPASRHYTFDHLTGEVRFGDGQRGLPPPQGRGNIRAARYRIGGGSRGNLPAGAINQIKSTFPYVAGVTNWAPAGGGADQEDLDRAKERGPKALRHRGRAVTLQDFEDLAYEASPEVARARAIGPNHKEEGLKPGEVRLVIVPRSADPQPSPSAELRRLVQEYIKQRCSQEVKLAVVGPGDITVTVTAEIAAARGFEAAHTLPATARAALQRFLHPLTGGFDQRGWAFGRQPQKSDLYRLLHAIEGVDHVSRLDLSFIPADVEFGPTKLVTSGDHEIHLAQETS